jgi:hypothetical protein
MALPTMPVRLVCPWVVAAVLALVCLQAARAAETRNVLVLYATSRLLRANVQYDQGLRETIRTSADRPVALFDEFLDVSRFGGQAYTDTVVTYLRAKYATRPPALIVVANEEALSFLVSHRATFYPQGPVVHMSVGRSFLRSNPALSADIVGVPIEYEFTEVGYSRKYCIRYLYLVKTCYLTMAYVNVLLTTRAVQPHPHPIDFI